MIHLYYGDGKGKTTAACGLAMRAAGSGMKVLFAQFFKDGTSSELKALSQVKGIEITVPSLHFGRYKTMNAEQRELIGAHYREMLDGIIKRSGDFGLILLDEAVSVYGYDMIDREVMMTFLKREGRRREIALTGRDPLPELIDIADYATEMRKEKHPYDKGVGSRPGIEY